MKCSIDAHKSDLQIKYSEFFFNGNNKVALEDNNGKHIRSYKLLKLLTKEGRMVYDFHEEISLDLQTNK